MDTIKNVLKAIDGARCKDNNPMDMVVMSFPAAGPEALEGQVGRKSSFPSI